VSRKRSQSVKYRNIRLTIETYERLDNYRLELMQQKKDTRISLNETVATLLEEHYSKQKGENGRKERSER